MAKAKGELQLELFGGKPAARRRPKLPPYVRTSETSKAAAESMREPAVGIRARVLATFLAAGQTGLTDDELVAALPEIIRHTTVPRRVELRDAGYVFDSGRRRPTERGRAATVWAHRDFRAVLLEER